MTTIGTSAEKDNSPTVIDVDGGTGIRYDTGTGAGAIPKDGAAKSEDIAPDKAPDGTADIDAPSKTESTETRKRSGRRRSSTGRSSGRRRSRRESSRGSVDLQTSGDVGRIMELFTPSMSVTEENSAEQKPSTSRRKGSTVKTELSDFDDVLETLTHQTSLRLPNNAFVKIRTHIDRHAHSTDADTMTEARSVVSVSMWDTEYIIEVTRDRISCTKRCIQIVAK